MCAILTPISYSLTLAALCAARFFRDRIAPLPVPVSWPVTWLPILAVTAEAWPAVVRPLLDGDSLAYHLPNAAAWVHASSMWTTSTYYWWYPPASEVFAAGLYAVSGPYSLGLAGAIALLLLGLRLASWCAEYCDPWVAGAIAAATVAIPSLALQAGTLQNDAWLAAFFIEALWAYHSARRGATRSLATLAMIKPIGVVWALLAQASNPQRFRYASLLSYAPLAVWWIHNGFLFRHAMVPTISPAYAQLLPTTILGQGIEGLHVLISGLIHDGLWTVLLTVSALAAVPTLQNRSWLASGYGTLFAFLLLPYAYQTEVPQLATGHSLRFLAPLFSIGALGIAVLLRRAPALVAFAPGAIAIAGIFGTVNIFWNDATVHDVGWICAAVALVSILSFLRWSRFATAVLMVWMVYTAHGLAMSHPADYYNDVFSESGRRTHFFTWLQSAHMNRAVVKDLRSGAVSVISPATMVFDADPARACGQAKDLNALLIYGLPSSSRNNQCGRIIYQDSRIRVSEP